MVRTFLLSLGFILSFAAFANTGYWAPRYHDHTLMQKLQPYAYTYINKGRIQVVTLREEVTFQNLPEDLKGFLKPVDPAVLSQTPVDPTWIKLKRLLGFVKPQVKVQQVVDEVSEAALRSNMENIVSYGRRTTNASIEWVMAALLTYGYQPIHDYNIEAVKIGKTKPDEIVIIEGHMDTVANTVGADDNASGTAGVLEAARVLADVDTERTIVFLITEDEERGLLGARRYVRDLQNNGETDRVKFVVNMDMIAYNSNGIVDLETEPEFESLADWMAEQTILYTQLSPNKVLNAWGSDHVPFIEAGIPALLTIEHWNTHTPCWHRSCDTLDTVNFAYATQIVRLNVAALLLKAGVITN